MVHSWNGCNSDRLHTGGLSVVWGIQGFTDDRSGFQRVVVPGTNELQIKETGEYTVYHEYKSQMDGDVINSQCADLNNYKFHLYPKGRPEQHIPLHSTDASSSYEFGSRKGKSTFSFRIQEPGTYVFDSQRKEEEANDCERAVLAIGQGVLLGFFLNLLKIVGGGCFFLLFSAGGLTILLVTFFTNTNQEEQVESATPDQPSPE